MTGDRIEITIVKGGATLILSEKLPDAAYESHGFMSLIAAIEPAVDRMLGEFARKLTTPNRIYREETDDSKAEEALQGD